MSFQDEIVSKSFVMASECTYMKRNDFFKIIQSFNILRFHLFCCSRDQDIILDVKRRLEETVEVVFKKTISNSAEFSKRFKKFIESTFCEW